jgi:hypothetical protein
VLPRALWSVVWVWGFGSRRTGLRAPQGAPSPWCNWWLVAPCLFMCPEAAGPGLCFSASSPEISWGGHGIHCLTPADPGLQSPVPRAASGQQCASSQQWAVDPPVPAVRICVCVGVRCGCVCVGRGVFRERSAVFHNILYSHWVVINQPVARHLMRTRTAHVTPSRHHGRAKGTALELQSSIFKSTRTSRPPIHPTAVPLPAPSYLGLHGLQPRRNVLQ